MIAVRASAASSHEPRQIFSGSNASEGHEALGWLAARHDRPALSTVGWAMDLSRHCDRSTGCEVAAEVRHVAQLSLELVEVNVLGCWLPRRSETCKQWIRGGWGIRMSGL